MKKVLQIPVSEVMTREVVFISPDDVLPAADKIFQANTFHHLPVVDSAGKLTGIISNSDLLRVRKVLLLLQQPSSMGYVSIRVHDIMTVQVATLSPEDSLYVAADIFMENLFHALPVCADGILVGMLTTHDLLRYCLVEPPLLE